MRIIPASVEILSPPDGEAVLRHIEACGRVCYKSEDRMTPESARTFIGQLIRRGHESVLEHAGLSVRFVCDRGVTHEIVRHRIASFSQESTRYCNYANDKFGREITVVRPLFFEEGGPEWELWRRGCEAAETAYLALLDAGRSPQEARAVLPNSLKTELVMTANLREWRHFFRLRTAAASHPQMREVARALLARCRETIPVVFDDIDGRD